MSVQDSNTSPEVLADARIVAHCLTVGQPIPSEVSRRAQERANEARKKLLGTHGIQSSGVQIIREIRGELPES